ncbi:sulfatase [Natronorarus salvus]|uniref:sulfatase n=1 Tax=Natronorarus salvus TaxID=3117733 RepID=UPI002F25FC30
MDRPNVLLVVLDSVRAANTSLSGHRHRTTPALDRFAERATVYRQARAPGVWSLPSHVSLFTGLDVPEHGVTIDRRIEPGHTVFERLEGRGYATGVFSSNVYITAHPVGIGDRFGTVVGVPESVPEGFEVSGEFEMAHPTGFWYAERFLEWVDERENGKPWAACVNVMDAHRPYLPEPGYDRWGEEDAREVQRELGRGEFVWKFYGERYPYWYLAALEGLYDGAVRQADAVLHRLLRGLEERDGFDDTLVVVCSDHGDGLGELSAVPSEPRCIAHTLGTNEALTHVPLVVKAPAQTEGREVDELASLTRFPAAVEAFTDPDSGGADTDDSVFAAPDGRCLTYRDEIDGPKLDAARRYCGDRYGEFVSESVAVYGDLPGRAVGKRAMWDGEAVRSTVYGARAEVIEGPVEPDEVSAALSGYPLRDIGTDRDECEEELGPAVRAHLADIGYL